MKTASDFLAERQVKAGETLPKLNPAQIRALMGDDYPLNMAWATHWQPLPPPPASECPEPFRQRQ